MNDLQKEIDCNFQWTFHKSSGVFKTKEEFIEAVNNHLDELNKKMPNIQMQNGQISWSPSLDGYKERDEGDKVTWNPEEVVISNPTVYITYGKETPIILTADDGKGFTMGELMFKLHKILSKKNLGDHVFPEIFQLLDEIDGIPLYRLLLGS